MQKIMLAVSHNDLENLIRNSLKGKFLFCNEDLVYLEEIYSAIKKENPDILLLRESIDGSIDVLNLIYKIKKSFPTLRIIFLSIKRNTGDKMLATLVSLGVYDINHEGVLKTSEVLDFIRKPRTYKDVAYLQPVPMYDKDKDSLSFEAPEAEIREVLRIVEKNKGNEETENKEEIDEDKEDKEEMDNEEDSNLSVNINIKNLPKINIKDNLSSMMKKGTRKENKRREDFKEFEEFEGFKEENNNDEISIEYEDDEYEMLEKNTKDKERVINKDNEKIRQKNKGPLNQIIKNEKIDIKLSQGKKIISFISGKEGSGTSTIAFGFACALAGMKEKVLYIDLNNKNPSISYYYELQKIEVGLETFVSNMNKNDSSILHKSIIKGIDIKKGNVGYEGVFENHSKFPENLDFLGYSSSHILSSKNKTLLNKECIFYLMGQLRYDTLIIDCQGDLKSLDILDSLVYSTTIISVINQDVLSLGYIYPFLSNYDGLLDKTIFVYNMKGKSKGGFTEKEAKKWTEKEILSISYYSQVDPIYYSAQIPFIKIGGFRNEIIKLAKKIK